MIDHLLPVVVRPHLSFIVLREMHSFTGVKMSRRDFVISTPTSAAHFYFESLSRLPDDLRNFKSYDIFLIPFYQILK